jgi:CheY-like chemotaxis protein
VSEPVVLVVGSDAGARRATAAALRERLGAHTLAMAGGDPAVAWARVLRPSLAFVDMDPGHDAESLVARLAALPEARGMQVVGVGQPESHDRARHAGCRAFVGKPLVPSELARVAGELLS